MLRHAALRGASPLRRAILSTACRSFAAATSAQKRALNKSQLKGDSGASKPPPPTTPPPPSPPKATSGGGSSTSPPPPPPGSSSQGGSSSSSSTFLPMAIAGVVAVGGAAYYYSTLETSVPTTTDKAPEPAATKDAEPAAVVAKKEAAVRETKESETKKEEPSKETVSKPTGNRVLSIELPSGTRSASVTAAPMQHPAGGHRVKMAPPPPPAEESSVEEAVKELRASEQEEASETIQQAHAALRANLDESLFADLDKLGAAELRVRVVQLAAEMKERTKWEAVRLKEFLAMKEKETADKYMEVMQKQRLEMEAQMARNLRQQEDMMNRQAQAELQQKEDSIQEVMEAAKAAQEAEHQADLESAKGRLETELNAKYETDYAQKLANEKVRFVEELQTRVDLVEELSSKVKQLEGALKQSQALQSGSLRAHRLSAAALALAEKLETSEAASAELEALKSAAKDNMVIESALQAVPASVSSGIPSLMELQSRFERVYKKSRQAAMVPAGRSGLEGQLAGMAFSTLKYAPDPETPAPEHAKDDAEYVLARARRHVQLGELERAVEQLDKLHGQAAFTVKDWKQHAKDRIAIDKTVRAIKMEIAVLNKSMSDSSGDVSE